MRILLGTLIALIILQSAALGALGLITLQTTTKSELIYNTFLGNFLGT